MPGARSSGMFAFAILDHRGRMFLARDFFGIKPLYYVRAVWRHWRSLRRSRPCARSRASRAAPIPSGCSTTSATGRPTTATTHSLRRASAPRGALDGSGPPAPATPTTPGAYWDLRPGPPRGRVVPGGRPRTSRAVSRQRSTPPPERRARRGRAFRRHRLVGDRAAMRVVEPRADVHTFSYVADDPAIGEERFADLAGAASAGATRQEGAAEAGRVGRRPRSTGRGPGRAVRQHQHLCPVPRIPAGVRAGIKVMLDGQGADEMFGGYPVLTWAPGWPPCSAWRMGERVRLRAPRSPAAGSRRCGHASGPRGWTPLLPPMQAAAQAPASDGRAVPRWMNAGWFASPWRSHDTRPHESRAATSSANGSLER